MAGDWIKMRTDLYRDPKVCIIADHLISPDGELAAHVNQNCQCDMTVTRNVMRNVTVGALVTLWGVTRHRGKRCGDDLIVRNATISICDDIAELPGLGKAMESVGWLVQSPDGLIFPRFFEEFNVDPVDEHKLKNAERQRRYREKRNATRDVTVASQSNAREEKRREEKSTLSHSKGRHFENEEFRTAWASWKAKQAEVNCRPMDGITEEAQLYSLESFETSEAIAIVRFSTSRTNCRNLITNGDHKPKKSSDKQESKKKSLKDLIIQPGE